MNIQVGSFTLALVLAVPATALALAPAGGSHHSGGWGGWGGYGNNNHHSGGNSHHGGGWGQSGNNGWGGNHHSGGNGNSNDCDPLPGGWDDSFGDWDLPDDDSGNDHHGGSNCGDGHYGGGNQHDGGCGKKKKKKKGGGGWCDPEPDDAEGCTPGYWKTHPERWDNVDQDDFTISVKHQAAFNQFFGVTSAQSGMLDTDTLLDAVFLGGGGVNALNRHAAAAAASADAPAVNYEFSLSEVIEIYQDSVGAISGSLDLSSGKKRLEKQNEKGCPLGGEDPDITPYCLGDEGECPCGDSLSGGCPNATGNGALLSGSGSTSAVLDDLVLTTTQLPQDAFAMTFMGPASDSLPFGNGRLCASAGGAKLFRFLPALNSGPDGTIQLGPGIVDMSQVNAFAGGNITAGSTWYFQTYYRDLNANCDTNFNLSNAVRVDFLP